MSLQSNSESKTTKQLDVPYAIDSLVRQVEILGKVVDNLNIRLDPIMSPPSPESPDKIKAEVEPARSALSNQIFSIADNIRRMRSTIDMLISRTQI